MLWIETAVAEGLIDLPVIQCHSINPIGQKRIGEVLKRIRGRVNDHQVQLGESYRVFYNEGNSNNKLIHIRAIVDDKYFVYRYWVNPRKGWVYKLESVYWLQAAAKYMTKI